MPSLTQVFERWRLDGAIIIGRFMFAPIRSLVVFQFALYLVRWYGYAKPSA
jgi:hypothetical protein